ERAGDPQRARREAPKPAGLTGRDSTTLAVAATREETAKQRTPGGRAEASGSEGEPRAPAATRATRPRGRTRSMTYTLLARGAHEVAREPEQLGDVAAQYDHRRRDIDDGADRDLYDERDHQRYARRRQAAREADDCEEHRDARHQRRRDAAQVRGDRQR